MRGKKQAHVRSSYDDAVVIRDGWLWKQIREQSSMIDEQVWFEGWRVSCCFMEFGGEAGAGYEALYFAVLLSGLAWC